MKTEYKIWISFVYSLISATTILCLAPIYIFFIAAFMCASFYSFSYWIEELEKEKKETEDKFKQQVH